MLGTMAAVLGGICIGVGSMICKNNWKTETKETKTVETKTEETVETKTEEDAVE